MLAASTSIVGFNYSRRQFFASHRGLARRLVAVGRRGVLVVAKGQRPHPRRGIEGGRDGFALCVAADSLPATQMA